MRDDGIIADDDGRRTTLAIADRDRVDDAGGDVLASQFFEASTRRSPERDLLVAVLEDAMQCIERHAGAERAAERALCADAQRWMASRDRSWFFSFENVCAALDLDADAVRAGVTRAHERAAARAPVHPAAGPPGDRARDVGDERDAAHRRSSSR